MPTLEELEQFRDQLLAPDDRFYSEKCLKIVDQREQTVPLAPKPAQDRFEELALEQALAGLPIRIIVLKARKEGISTWVQGKIVKRITTRKNHKALVVAHDKPTAGEIFDIGEGMYSHLPDSRVADLQLKPAVVGSRKQTELRLGEPSRTLRHQGHQGINSTYRVDTANEVQTGRGFTFHSLHLSELAFWGDAVTKLIALLNTVPNEPGTMIVIESTANGYNTFRDHWVRAMKGESDYAPLFIAWFEDPDYRIPFTSEQEREEFRESVGSGPWGEDEPKLLKTYGCTLEQLKWRRWAIVNRCEADLQKFQQEYPATWEEAFLASGRNVFSQARISAVLRRCEKKINEGTEGFIEATEYETREVRGHEIKVPQSPLWVPRSQKERAVGTTWWRMWEPPEPGREFRDPETGNMMIVPRGQYVVAVDAASGEETSAGDEDYFAIQIINHRTRAQCARWKAQRTDPDLVAEYAFLAALLYNRAWIAVEITGGHGWPIIRKIRRDWRGSALLYYRQAVAHKHEKQEERVGWDTQANTKPLLIAHMKDLLRTNSDGIRDVDTASEMLTFVKDENGRMEAEDGYHDDLLMTYMIGQYVANEKPLRRSDIDRQRTPSPSAPLMGAVPSHYG